MNTAMPGAARPAERTVNGVATPMADGVDATGRGASPRPASDRFTDGAAPDSGTAPDGGTAAPHNRTAAADRHTAAADGPVHAPPLAPADPVAAALEQLRRNRATMVRSLAARPRRRSDAAPAGHAALDRWSLARTIGAGAIEVTARQHPFLMVGAALVAGITLARLVGRRSIVRPMLLAPLLSRMVAPMVMRMATDAAMRMVRGAAEHGGPPRRAADRDTAYRGAPDRDTLRSSGSSAGVPHPP
ncbi:MAG TPA: hypothetical protein PKA20_25345 [Burkholderiaceae bacterium]|nr:hypothetical protein [Burkholderiaceae bacterium]